MKEIKDMDFSEFVDWATGYFVVNLVRENPRSLMYSILNNFALNWLPNHRWKSKTK